MGKRHMALIALASAIVVLIVAMVVVSCGSAATTTTKAAPTTTGVSTGATGGAALFAANCARCHDDLPSGSASEVQAIVESGKENMPPFKDTLTAAEIAAIVGYVTSGGK
jgi:mono/diheme cytochrome c family protein